MRLSAFFLALCAAALTGLFFLVPPVRALPLSASLPAPVARVLSAEAGTAPPVPQPQQFTSAQMTNPTGHAGCACPMCQQAGFALIQGRLPLSAEASRV